MLNAGKLSVKAQHDFPALAPGVAGAQSERKRLSAAGRSGVFGKARWRAASRVPSMSKTTRSLPARSTSPPVCLSLFNGRASRSSRKSVRKAFDRRLGETGKKATERRAGWQALPSEERHEGRGKGMQALVEGFERPFAADGVPEEHGHKVNHVVVAEATPGKARALTDGGKDTLRGVGAGQSGRLRRTRVASRAPIGKRSGSSPIHRQYCSCRSP